MGKGKAQTLHYQWDKLGRLTCLTNENGATYQFVYDAASRLTEERDFDGQITSYKHETRAGHRRVTQHTADWLTVFEYDPLGKLLRKEVQQYERQGTAWMPLANTKESESFQYDAAGRPTSANNRDARLQWFYDPVGNLVREQHTYSFLKQPTSYTWLHEYDELDQRVATVRPDQLKLQWLSYGSGHVHGLMLDGQEVVGFERDDLHRESRRIQANGLTQDSSYNANGQLTVQNLRASDRQPGTGGDTTPTLTVKRQYRYDPAGQLDAIEGSRRGALRYKYDPASRLVEAASALGTELFAFDPAGNLLDAKLQDTSATVTQPQNADAYQTRSSLHHQTTPPALLDNLLRHFQQTGYEYDQRGQRVKATAAGRPAEYFDWDGFGRLRRFARQGDVEARYYYDPMGRRIGKHSEAIVYHNPNAGDLWRPQEIARRSAERGLGITLYGWEGDTLAWEHGQTEAVQYINQPGSFVPMLRVTRKWGKDQPRELAWFQCDHLGTPMELTDQQGDVVWSAQYRAFGEAQIAQHKLTNNVRFQGQYLDQESGLHYNRHRYYDPTSRYVSKDPIGLAGGMGIYTYARSSPTNVVDPKGLDTYIVNRDLQIFGNSASSRLNPITHTFVAVTNPDGSIAQTYSWGNEANVKGWNVNQPLDLKTAKEAVSNNIAEKVGGQDFDPYVDEAYGNLNKKQYQHMNGIIAYNCKSETQNLMAEARRVQNQTLNPLFGIPTNPNIGTILIK